MALDKIHSHLSQHAKNETKLPPLESWNPPFCGDIDIVIKANGDWFYNGSRITRKPLVKLFASVIKKEGDEYFLVTPVEKVRIQVEDQPFLVTHWEQLTTDEGQQAIALETNLDDKVMLSPKTPLVLEGDALLVTIRRNLQARVNRNVFYQWVEMAQEITKGDTTELVITSMGTQFSLGKI